MVTAIPTASVEASMATTVAEPVAMSVVDMAGSDEFFVKIPAEWITITARDIADDASFGAWRGAHPEEESGSWAEPIIRSGPVLGNAANLGRVAAFPRSATTIPGLMTPGDRTPATPGTLAPGEPHYER